MVALRGQQTMQRPSATDSENISIVLTLRADGHKKFWIFKSLSENNTK